MDETAQTDHVVECKRCGTHILICAGEKVEEYCETCKQTIIAESIE